MEKNILILGGGFGGLAACLNLSRKLKKNKNYKIYLIDKKPFHTYNPLLYKIATFNPKNKNISDLYQITNLNYNKILNNNIIFYQDEIVNIDFLNQKIEFKNYKNLNFDYLVIALGCQVNDFNIISLKKYALFLKTFEDALKIREKIYSLSQNLTKKLKIFIAGGGPSGIELAFEIKNLSNKFDIFIIEKNKEILKNFSSTTKKIINKKLKKEKIIVFNSETIKKVTKDKIYLQSKNFFEYDIFIFTGGNKIPDFLKKLPFNIENERIKVNSNLNCLLKEEILNLKPDLKNKIFAIGDLIYYFDEKTKLINPQTAQAAIIQGKIVAKNIYLMIEKPNNPLKKYKIKKQSYIISLGEKNALLETKFFVLKGFFVWILKGLIELNYLIKIINVKKAILIWLKGFKVFLKFKKN